LVWRGGGGRLIGAVPTDNLTGTQGDDARGQGGVDRRFGAGLVCSAGDLTGFAKADDVVDWGLVK
jgi:hypothetical protein